jgi:hypothetical protein
MLYSIDFDIIVFFTFGNFLYIQMALSISVMDVYMYLNHHPRPHLPPTT